MRILLLILVCIALLGCQPNQQDDHSQESLKATEGQAILEEAEKELSRRVGQDFNYFPLLGDRDPPLDYRN